MSRASSITATTDLLRDASEYNGDISWVSDVEYIASKSNEAISLNYLKDNDVDEVSVVVKGGKQRKAE